MCVGGGVQLLSHLYDLCTFDSPELWRAKLLSAYQEFKYVHYRHYKYSKWMGKAIGWRVQGSGYGIFTTYTYTKFKYTNRWSPIWSVINKVLMFNCIPHVKALFQELETVELGTVRKSKPRRRQGMKRKLYRINEHNEQWTFLWRLTIVPPFDIWAGHPNSDILCVSVCPLWVCTWILFYHNVVVFMLQCKLFLLSLLFSQYLVSSVSA